MVVPFLLAGCLHPSWDTIKKERVERINEELRILKVVDRKALPVRRELAIAELRQIVREADYGETSFAAQLELGHLLAAAGRWDEALREFSDLAARAPANPPEPTRGLTFPNWRSKAWRGILGCLDSRRRFAAALHALYVSEDLYVTRCGFGNQFQFGATAWYLTSRIAGLMDFEYTWRVAERASTADEFLYQLARKQRTPKKARALLEALLRELPESPRARDAAESLKSIK